MNRTIYLIQTSQAAEESHAFKGQTPLQTILSHSYHPPHRIAATSCGVQPSDCQRFTSPPTVSRHLDSLSLDRICRSNLRLIRVSDLRGLLAVRAHSTSLHRRLLAATPRREQQTDHDYYQ